MRIPVSSCVSDHEGFFAWHAEKQSRAHCHHQLCPRSLWPKRGRRLCQLKICLHRFGRCCSSRVKHPWEERASDQYSPIPSWQWHVRWHAHKVQKFDEGSNNSFVNIGKFWITVDPLMRDHQWESSKSGLKIGAVFAKGFIYIHGDICGTKCQKSGLERWIFLWRGSFIQRYEGQAELFIYIDTQTEWFNYTEVHRTNWVIHLYRDT